MIHFTPRVYAVILLFLFTINSPANAQNILVPTNGPATGAVQALAQQGTDLYACMNSGGLYKSIDGGLNWIHLNLPGDSYQINYVMADDSLIFASYVNLYRSSDHGQTWQVIPVSGISQISAFGNGYIAMTGEIMYISDSTGQVWTLASNFLSPVGVANYMFVAGDTIYLGSSTSGLYKSTDSAQTWSLAANRGNIPGVSDVIRYGSRIFAATSNGVWVSENDGGSWTALSYTGLNPIGVLWLRVYNDTVYGCTYAGSVLFYDSIQFAWYTAPKQNCHISSFYSAYLIDSSNRYSTTDNGVYVSEQNSAWQLRNSGMIAGQITNIVSDSQMVLCSAAGGLFSTTDDGLSWNQVTPDACFVADGYNPFGYSLFVNEDTILTSNGSGLYGLILPATNWTNFGSVPVQFIKKGGRLFVSFSANDGSGDGTNSYTDDWGQTWTNVPSLGGAYARSALVDGGKQIYGSFYRNQLYSSSDQGTTWVEVLNFPSRFSMTGGAVIDSTGYFSSPSGVFYSSDGGQSWDTAGSPLSNPIHGLTALNGSLYGINDSALYLYDAANNLWHRLCYSPNHGLLFNCITAHDNHLFIGTAGNSVYVYGPAINHIPAINAADIKAKVFPNPAQDIITVTATNTIKTAQFFNVMGQQVMSRNVGVNKSQVNITDFTPGIYFIRLTGADFETTLKLVKD